MSSPPSHGRRAGKAGPWDAALPHERWAASAGDSAPVPQTVRLASSGREGAASPPEPDRDAGSVLSDILGSTAKPVGAAPQGRRRPATAKPRLQADPLAPERAGSPAPGPPARHGRRAGLQHSPELPLAGPDAGSIASEVLGADGGGESPPTYTDLDAKLRALSGRDPKLAGMLEEPQKASTKAVEQAVELERLSGEIAVSTHPSQTHPTPPSDASDQPHPLARLCSGSWRTRTRC